MRLVDIILLYCEWICRFSVFVVIYIFAPNIFVSLFLCISDNTFRFTQTR